jgi:AcrR family transcriptional regulator
MINMKLKAASSAPRAYAQTARARSTEETGRRIADAFLSRLMTQWYDEITLDAVAADAGVTVQTILRRFYGKDGLLGTAAKTIGAQINAKRAMPANDIAAMADSLFADYEQTGDTVMRLLAMEDRYPAVKGVTDLGRREHRQWLSNVLAAPLGLLDTASRQLAVDALVIVTDVYAWKLLRRDMCRSVPVAKATMKSLIHAAITGATNAKLKGAGQ